MKSNNVGSRIGAFGMCLMYGCLGVMMITSLVSLVFLFVICTC
jgi:hypothetical protein